MMRTVRVFIAVAFLTGLVLIVAACGSGDDATVSTAAGTSAPASPTTPGSEGPSIPDGPTIIVGSTNFGEQLILGDIYATVLEQKGYPVERSFNLGSREVVNPAMKSGEIDVLAEYTGALLSFEGGTFSTDSQETWERLVTVLEGSGVTAMAYSPAQAKDGFVVTAETARDLDLTSVSDLKPHGGDLVLGGPPECPNRDTCLLGLQRVYELEFAEFQPLDVGGELTVAALEGGQIDVAVLFTSDGVIAAKGFVLLEDDRGLQPAQNIVPVIRTEILDVYGDNVTTIINEVSAAITTAELSELNRRFSEGADPKALALEWLRGNGFVEG